MTVTQLFNATPLETYTTKQIQYYTNLSKDVVESEIKQLLIDKTIIGEDNYRLTVVPQHIMDIPKNKNNKI